MYQQDRKPTRAQLPDPRRPPGRGAGLLGSRDGAMLVQTSGNGRRPVIDIDRNCTGNDDERDDERTGHQRHVTYLLQPIAHVCPISEEVSRQRSRPPGI